MKYLFIAGLFLSMTAVGLTIHCYICVGCDTVTQSQLQDCSSTSDNVCVTDESSGQVVRKCGSSSSGCIGNGCIFSHCKEDITNGIRVKICICQPDGCNGQTLPETTTLASTESPTLRCYVCVGCDTVTQSQLQDCSSTFYDACSTVETSGFVERSCGFSATGTGCTEDDNFLITRKTCTCQTDGCNGPTPPKTTTLASTTNGSNGDGSTEANIVGSLIAVVVGKILM